MPRRAGRARLLSSNSEGARLATPAYRDTIAAAIFAGIQAYAETLRRLNPATVAPANKPAGGAPPATQVRSQPTRPALGP